MPKQLGPDIKHNQTLAATHAINYFESGERRFALAEFIRPAGGVAATRRAFRDTSVLAFRTALCIASFGAVVGGVAPAEAGVGLAVVADLPDRVTIGEGQLNGSITITNANSDRDAASSNLVFQISLTPSCGARAVATECPGGAEDPGVFALSPTAVGRSGTACEGTVFTVNVRNPATGEVTFDAPAGFVKLGSSVDAPSARQCIIDFALVPAARPTRDASSAGRTARFIETTAYAGAWAMSTAGLRPGVGGNATTLQVH